MLYPATFDPRLWSSANKHEATHRVLFDRLGARFIVPCEHFGTHLLKAVVPLRSRLRIQLTTALTSPIFCVPTELTRALVDEIALQYPIVIGRMGAPGPYCKDVLMLFEREHVPKVVLKVGTSTHGAELVRNEASNIERLLKNPSMEKFLPNIVFSRTLSSGYVMAEQFAQGETGTQQMRREYLDFLKALHSEPCDSASSVLQRCEGIALELWSALGARWKNRIERCLVALHRLPSSLPVVFAHRDFTCWNVVHGRGGMTVLDWEYAAAGYTPMHDLFHFLLFRRGLSHDLSVSTIRKTIYEARFAAEEIGHSQITQAAPLQLLSYLLDLCLLHLKSHEGKASSRVAERYGDAIDAFPDWSS
jgi:thiamine kinase-like enzyme